MKRVLVTGAAGQLGLTIKDLALDYPNLQFEFKTREDLDITNKKSIEKVFSDSQYDYCINCAAYTHVEKAEQEPQKARAVNEEAVKNLAYACLKYDIILIHISTDYVFDGEKNSPYHPDDRPNPINEYGKSKWFGEQFIQKVMEKFYIVRTSWLYSKKHGKNFYKTIVNKAKNGEEIRVTDAQTGCPTNTVSLSRYLLEELVLGQKSFGISHFSDGKAMTWYGFAKHIIQENGLTEKVNLAADKNYHTFVKRPKNSCLIASN